MFVHDSRKVVPVRAADRYAAGVGGGAESRILRADPRHCLGLSPASTCVHHHLQPPSVPAVDGNRWPSGLPVDVAPGAATLAQPRSGMDDSFDHLVIEMALRAGADAAFAALLALRLRIVPETLRL